MNQLRWITNSLLFGVIAFSLLFTSCKPKHDEVVTPSYSFGNGVYITNEGNFGDGNGTISFYNKNTNTIFNDIYGTANNNAKLGDVVQSINIIDSNAYIVVNASNKVEIVNASTFKHISTITEVIQPRYIQGLSNRKAYITQWGTSGINGAVKVLDLNTNTITKTISIGKGAEKMLKHGDDVYVTCSGGYGYDETVSVINTNTDAVSTSIVVGPNPKGIVEDAQGKIWVLCAGKYKSDYSGLEQTGKLVRIDPATNTVEASFDFSSTSSQPSQLTIDTTRTKLYYSYIGKVFSHDITATALNTTEFLNKNFYGLGVDPITNILYGAVSGDFKSAGHIERYNSSGTYIDNANAGVGTSGFFFK